MEEETGHAQPLTMDDVSRIHLQGGSVLFTSRANPTKQPEKLEATVQALRELELDALLTIGVKALRAAVRPTRTPSPRRSAPRTSPSTRRCAPCQLHAI